jgi:2',3'-cyclic-nucleotide 2'-phosphodiesterase (5'-nucleotidase family)
LACVRLLFTSDLHGRLTAELAQRLAALKAERPDTLLLDAGDAIKAGNVAIPLRPEAAWAHMAEAGYDALTIGNRESHITEFGLRAKLKGAPMPVLCANMLTKGTDTPRLAPFVVLGLAGSLRVGVLGLSVPMVTERMKSRIASAFLYISPIEAAQGSVPELRPKCDLLVALTHIGLDRDVELAKGVDGIDAIIGGHTHEVLREPMVVNGCPIVHAGSHGRLVGDLLLRMDGEVAVEQYRLLPLAELPR